LIESQNELTIRQPDDWHLHLREGPLMQSVLPYTSRVFRRAIVMPNLISPITSVSQAVFYRNAILNALPLGHEFTPLMTAYLTDDMSPDVLEEGYEQKVFFAAKLYPVNATTNSSKGVNNIKSIYNLLAVMERIGLPLLIHGEVVDKKIDIFDREKVFIERYLKAILNKFPSLKVVLEHITTEQAVRFVEDNSKSLAATITPHHLHINRNAMFNGGLRSDFYCLPVAKRENHRLALRSAATSGKPCFFLGTDSAPHLRSSKESLCGCAGIFNSPYAIESYAEVFTEEKALYRLEAFSSEFGPKYYGLPLNQNFIKLKRQVHEIPDFLEIGKVNNFNEKLVPFHAGEYLKWTFRDLKT